MIDLKKEIERLERSLDRLYVSLGQLPADLKQTETAKTVRSLIDSAEKKVALLKKEERKCC